MYNTDFLCTHPAVYVVGDKYEIVFKTYEPGAAWVVIDGVRYTDNYGGVVRSSSKTHKVYVKQEILDSAGKYTVVLARIPERPAYYPKTVCTFEKEYSFRPIPDGEIRAYMLSDTHSHVTAPVSAAEYFGEGNLDLLIMGGDNGNTADDEASVMTMAKIAGKVTKGEIPVIYMRGNHDNRGAFAEFLAEYVGTDSGRPYFEFTLGRVHGIILDAGEDKLDSCVAYGDIADYTAFRREQLDFLRGLNMGEKAEGELRLVLCHVPFASFDTPFNDIFAEWTEELNKMDIDLMLAGHRHLLYMFEKGESRINDTVANFPVAVGSKIDKKVAETYVGTAMVIKEKSIELKYTDIEHNVVEEHTVSLA